MSSQENENSYRETRIDPKTLNSLNESIQLLKNYNPMHSYIPNHYVDVIDSYSSWRISKIIDIKDDAVLVNFDGWSTKWNEVNNINRN